MKVTKAVKLLVFNWLFRHDRKAPSIEAQKRAVAASGLFSQDWYLSNNPDVRQSGMKPLDHFCLCGDRELRSPCLFFDSHAYERANPDYRASGFGPLAHFLLVKRSPLRQAGPLAVLKAEIQTANSDMTTAVADMNAAFAERDSLRLRVYALQASFDRSVREAEAVRKKYAAVMKQGVASISETNQAFSS